MKRKPRCLAEFIGTFWLVFCGCGSAVIATNFDALSGSSGIGLVGVSLAFGLSLLTMIYTVGQVSGGHFNPAVTIGLAVAKRFPGKHVVPYVAAQVIGATAASFVLYLIVTGSPDGATAGFATNGYGAHSPGEYSMASAFLCEALMTGFFVFIILGATDKRAPAGFAGLAVGLGLTVIHLVSIPITGTGVNPARSTGPAIVAALLHHSAALHQLWLFWVAPCIGAFLAAGIFSLVASECDAAASTPSEELAREQEILSSRGD